MQGLLDEQVCAGVLAITPKTKWLKATQSCGQQLPRLISASWGVELLPLLGHQQGHERNRAVSRMAKVTSGGGVTPIGSKRMGRAQRAGLSQPLRHIYRSPISQSKCEGRAPSGRAGGCPGHGEEPCDPLKPASALSPPQYGLPRKGSMWASGGSGSPARTWRGAQAADCHTSPAE